MWFITKIPFDTYEQAENWLNDLILHGTKVTDYCIEKKRKKYHLMVEVEVQ